MAGLADRPFTELLQAVADPTPAPAGGSVAAWACALAAGLAEMAAAIGGLPERGERAGELRAHALTLAERDAEAYAAVLAARREGGDAAAALSAAADPPLAVAEAAAEVAGLAADVAAHGKPALRGDAITGALLAEAAATAAARLVEIDLAGDPADARLEAARGAAGRAAAARERALDLG